MSETRGPEAPKPVPDYNNPSPPPMDPMIYPLGTIGAVVGAVLGVGVMKIGLQSGFYAEVAIGLLAGWLGGLAARRPSWAVGAIAGVVTLVTGLWAEWKLVGPLVGDESFLYFVTHVYKLSAFKLLSHAIGVAAAVWIAARR